MLKNLKTLLFSENGMKIVNALFFFTVFFRSGVLTILTYTLWLVFLSCSFRRTESRGMKGFYLLLAAFAAAVTVWELIRLLSSLFEVF